MTDREIKLMQLKNYQSMSLGAKITRTKHLIREWYDYYEAQVYGSLSGKDSCTMMDIVWSMYPDVPAVFSDTGNEMESVVRNILDMKAAGRPITIVRPKMTFEEVIEKYGYPVISKEQSQRISEVKSLLRRKAAGEKYSQNLLDIRMKGYDESRGYRKGSGKISEKWKFVIDAPFDVTGKCCKYLKCSPCSEYEKETGRMPFVGVMTEESQLRKQSFMKYGCNAFGAKKNKASRPLIFWREQDILEYIRQFNVSIADVYGEIVGEGDGIHTTGEDRTGCSLCLFGADKDEVNKIQKLATLEPETYKHAIEDLKYDEVMDFMGLEWRPVDEVKKEGLVR